MPKANLYDITGKQKGEVELAESIFGIEPNETAVHAVVKNHLANCRQGTQSALTRGEVSGGGKKPWRQKGTGRARHVSTSVVAAARMGTAAASAAGRIFIGWVSGRWFYQW